MVSQRMVKVSMKIMLSILWVMSVFSTHTYADNSLTTLENMVAESYSIENSIIGCIEQVKANSVLGWSTIECQKISDAGRPELDAFEVAVVKAAKEFHRNRASGLLDESVAENGDLAIDTIIRTLKKIDKQRAILEVLSKR